ncbi:MAG: hypothetical protein JST86_04000 [Bacteroidetes bacterium]|nr:hypothetical protein [Bacteroidota bacterium]
MKKPFWTISSLIIAFSACKKSNSGTAETSPKYMSLAAGSTWTYESNNAVTATTTTNTVTSTSRDSSINSKTYHVFTNSNGAANDYYNITGNDYYTFKILSPALGISAVETIYLKENAAVGTTWSQTVNVTVTGFPTPVPVTFINTITETGISRTVNGQSYSDVIHITTGISVTGLPPGSISTDIQSYYARKFGLIESKNKISIPTFSVNADQTTILKAATIL